MKKVLTILIVFSTTVIASRAQLRLPPLEVNVKGTFNALISDKNETLMIGVQGGILVPISQYIGVGWMYCQTVYGTTHNGDQGDSPDYPTQQLITGPEVRFSGGRSRKVRPYLTLSYTKLEIVTDYDSYRTANKTTALGAQVGLMMKLGNRMYLNLIELGYRSIADESFWIPGSNKQVEFKTGLTYNFGKRK